MAYKKHALRRYELPSDPAYWVELRRLSLLDVQAINRDYLGGIRVAVGGSTPDVAVRDMDGSAATMAILRAAVRNWNLDDESGAALPVTDAALMDLEPEDLEFIVHTAVKGTLLEPTFGTASIMVQEAEEPANGKVVDSDSLFIVGASQP